MSQCGWPEPWARSPGLFSRQCWWWDYHCQTQAERTTTRQPAMSTLVPTLIRLHNHRQQVPEPHLSKKASAFLILIDIPPHILHKYTFYVLRLSESIALLNKKFGHFFVWVWIISRLDNGWKCAVQRSKIVAFASRGSVLTDSWNLSLFYTQIKYCLVDIKPCSYVYGEWVLVALCCGDPWPRSLKYGHSPNNNVNTTIIEMFSRHFLNIQPNTFFMTPLDLCITNKWFKKDNLWWKTCLSCHNMNGHKKSTENFSKIHFGRSSSWQNWDLSKKH